MKYTLSISPPHRGVTGRIGRLPPVENHHRGRQSTLRKVSHSNTECKLHNPTLLMRQGKTY